MIRTLIVEDEKHAIELLSLIVNEYCPELTLIGSASSLEEGKLLIETLEPDLIFLDIQLGDDISFEILDSLSFKDFKLIITTAYDQYALEGFKHEAVDYILKPYCPSRIVSAVNRVKRIKRDEDVFQKLSSMIHPKRNRPSNSKITIATSEGIHLVDHNDIIRLQAQKAYCEILLKGQKKLLVSKSMGEIEKQLPTAKFFRVHSGHLVHVDYVKQISNQDGGFLIMTDGSQVPLARRRRGDFLSAISS